MIVGAVGFVVSLLFWSSWGGFGSGHRRRSVYHRPDGSVVEEERRDAYM
jgi:hypothetical protein